MRAETRVDSGGGECEKQSALAVQGKRPRRGSRDPPWLRRGSEGQGHNSRGQGRGAGELSRGSPVPVPAPAPAHLLPPRETAPGLIEPGRDVRGNSPLECFDAVDTNHDHVIQFEEFEAALAQGRLGLAGSDPTAQKREPGRAQEKALHATMLAVDHLERQAVALGWSREHLRTQLDRAECEVRQQIQSHPLGADGAGLGGDLGGGESRHEIRRAMAIAGITQLRNLRGRLTRPSAAGCLEQWRSNAKGGMRSPLQLVIDDAEGLANLSAIRHTLALQRKLLTKAVHTGGKPMEVG